MHQKNLFLHEKRGIDIGEIIIYKSKIYEVLDIEKDGDLVLGNNDITETEASPKDCLIY